VSELKALVFSLNDSLMALAPRGWQAVDLTVVRAGGALQVSALATRGEGATQPRPRAQLQVDLEQEAARLGEGLTALDASLAGKWSGTAVRVERTGEWCDWRLLEPDERLAWFTRLTKEELGCLLVTDALLDAVTGTWRGFEALQAQLGQKLGVVTGFAFDPQRCLLALERPAGRLELSAQLVGAYLPEAFVWAWGWGDAQSTPASVERVRRVCAPDAQQEGLAAFWRPTFHCDEGFAWSVAGHLVVSLGARGLFRGELPDGSGVAYFAVLQLPA
jgi:hypothetical protein